jgi:hypothetical protein
MHVFQTSFVYHFCFRKIILLSQFLIHHKKVWCTDIFFFRSTEQGKNIMGKAPTWTTKEREVLALAWLRATNNGIQGADQKNEVFRNKIHGLFKALSPRDAPQGRFGDCSMLGGANGVSIQLFFFPLLLTLFDCREEAKGIL